MEKRACPICNSIESNHLFHQSFSGFADSNLLDSYDVVSCAKCGFTFADQIPNQAHFDIYYRELSKYENKGEALVESKYDLNRFSIMVKYLKDFIETPDKKIVEIGCATGFLLSLVKKAGYPNVMGIDPSKACSETAKKYYDIEVLNNTISSITLAPGSADWLMLVGVLEHVKDLDASLEIFWNLLPLGGKFFIAVPDGSEYYRGQDAPFQEFSVEHINYFGPQSLENLMLKNGFKKVDITQEMIEVNHKTITPVILSVFEKVDTRKSNDYTFDRASTDNLTKYIELCKQKDREIDEIIIAINAKHDKIMVWGTGAQTLRLMKASAMRDSNILAFIDSNPKYQGKTLNGIPVIAPSELSSKSEPILISTRAYQSEIEDQIKGQLKLPNDVIKLY
ncbi:MAG: class I SAM-dependent methyltransferase [Chitinophagales bacterium]|nr:class I SAM-dependent methyltransferase [Chitinophagales bacterium]